MLSDTAPALCSTSLDVTPPALCDTLPYFHSAVLDLTAPLLGDTQLSRCVAEPRRATQYHSTHRLCVPALHCATALLRCAKQCDYFACLYNAIAARCNSNLRQTMPMPHVIELCITRPTHLLIVTQLCRCIKTLLHATLPVLITAVHDTTAPSLHVAKQHVTRRLYCNLLRQHLMVVLSDRTRTGPSRPCATASGPGNSRSPRDRAATLL